MRSARIKDDYGIFHISQFSGDTNIFDSNDDRYKFLDIFKKAKDKFNFLIYAFCITKADQYHIIINTNGSDISKIMKSINISYCMYKNSKEKLFKDRYKSKMIENYVELIETVTTLHNEQTDGSIWNSYCSYSIKDSALSDVVDVIDTDKKPTESNGYFEKLIHCDNGNCIKSVPEAMEKILGLCSSKSITFAELLKDKPLRNQLIKDIRSSSTLSLKEIGEIFGGIGESTVSKIINGWHIKSEVSYEKGALL